MATKKAKKKVPKMKLYRESSSQYTITKEGLQAFLGWPEGFKVTGTDTNCKKKFVVIHGEKTTFTKAKNKTTTIVEHLERRVDSKEARKILGITNKKELFDGVEHDHDQLIVSTNSYYDGPYKA